MQRLTFCQHSQILESCSHERVAVGLAVPPSIWNEVLLSMHYNSITWRMKLHVYTNKYYVYLWGSRAGIKPAVRKGSWRMSWGVGRDAGSARRRRVIKDRAIELMCEGIRYSLRFILWYVSFKLSVSNGGFPTSKVYLHIELQYITQPYISGLQHTVCTQLTRYQPHSYDLSC